MRLLFSRHPVSENNFHRQDNQPGLGSIVDGCHTQVTELRIGHITGRQISKPRMVKRVMEIGTNLPPHLLPDRKFFVNGHFPDIEDFASHVREPRGEIPFREGSLSLGRK